jgi:CHAT domain-containing protein
MARKSSAFSIAQFLVRLAPRAEGKKRGILLLVFLNTVFLVLCLDTEISPATAQIPVVNPIVQNLPNVPRLVQQGRELYETGLFSQAVTVWQQAASASAAQGDTLSQAEALNYLSLTYQQLGQWHQATLAITNSLQLLEARHPNSSNQLQVLAQALNTQGKLQLSQGQAASALTTWQQAAATYKQAGDRVGNIGSLINQAQAMQALGLYLQAEQTLTQVEQVLTLQPNSIVKAMGLRSLGNTLRVVGDPNDSHRVLLQSLAIAQQLESPSDISAAELSLGNTARSQQDTQAALKFFQQAADASPTSITHTQAQLNQLSLLLETKSWSDIQALLPQIQSQLAGLPPSRDAVYARINSAQSLIKSKQSSAITTPSWLQIGQLLASAVQQAKSLKDRRAEAYALGYLGGLYEQTQQQSSAQSLTQEALILAQAINAPDISYRWQSQLGRLFNAQGDIKGAIAAYTESVKTLQSLRSDLVAINPDIQFSFRDEVEPIYRQLVDLLLQPHTTQPSQENLIQARDVIESLQLAELDNFFRIACLQGKPVQLDSVVDRDDPTAAVIYPIILPDRLEVILKLPKLPLSHYRIPVGQQEVERLLEVCRQKLTQPYTLQEVQTLSKQVYDWLIRPALADLTKSQVKTLVFVLDGNLRNIPMAALYDGQQYLVEKYAVALTPGLQLLPPKYTERIHLQALIAGLTEAHKGFSALTDVGSEIEQIKAEVPSKEFLNQKFTSTALQQQIDESPFPVVHLATHGQFSSQANQTFILAWDKRIFVNELNNLLQTRDQSRHNPLELLVLSACETAEGDKRAALGLAGVAVRAGARSTLASLWFLDDESSALLMGQFYQELANKNFSKAEALRRAQLALLPNPQYQHPRYWAPFVLVGNWL